jgi:hypothetical protein
MTVLYEDNYIICDDDAITINWYYFPVGSKRIAYNKIRQLEQENMDFWSGAGRIWGMGLTPHWFHLDPNRPNKNRCLIVDDGEWVKSVITPENLDRVKEILQEKTLLRVVEN